MTLTPHLGRIADKKECCRFPSEVVAMSLWIWIGIAASAVIACSLVVGLFVGQILAAIAREVSDLLEAVSPHTGAALSLTRALDTETVHSRTNELVTN
jgi:hypothetical protein